MFFVFRGGLLLCEHIARFTVHRIQRDHVLLAKTCNGARDVDFAPSTLANLLGKFGRQLGVHGLRHQFQSGTYFGVRQNIEEGRLPQRDRHSLLQRVIENRISGGVREVRDNDAMAA